MTILSEFNGRKKMKAYELMFSIKAKKIMKSSIVEDLYQKEKGILFQEGFLGMKKDVDDLAKLSNSFFYGKNYKKIKGELGPDVTEQEIFLAFKYRLLIDIEQSGFDPKTFDTHFYKMSEWQEERKRKEKARKEKEAKRPPLSNGVKMAVNLDLAA